MGAACFVCRMGTDSVVRTCQNEGKISSEGGHRGEVKSAIAEQQIQENIVTEPATSERR